MQAPVEIRGVRPADRERWSRLWDGYTAFYEVAIPAEVTDRTWARAIDGTSAMLGRVAAVGDELVGFSLSVLHDTTWADRPVCYLEDLFVDQDARGRGVGRRLIDDLLELARTERWSRLYWHTRRDNPARRLYDRFAVADDFVRYRIELDTD